MWDQEYVMSILEDTEHQLLDCSWAQAATTLKGVASQGLWEVSQWESAFYLSRSPGAPGVYAGRAEGISKSRLRLW